MVTTENVVGIINTFIILSVVGTDHFMIFVTVLSTWLRRDSLSLEVSKLGQNGWWWGKSTSATRLIVTRRAI